MPSPAPAPRLPLEPAERPLYRPPGRIGCSGVAVVCIAALFGFLFFSQVVAPAATERLRAVQLPRPFAVEPTATAALDAAIAVTPTVEPEPTFTPTPAAPTVTRAPPTPVPPSPTPTLLPAPPAVARSFVQVANTDGTGVYIRAEPRADGPRLIAVPDKTVLGIIGPDQTVNGQVWRNVRTTRGNIQVGWVLAQYLAPSP